MNRRRGTAILGVLVTLFLALSAGLFATPAAAAGLTPRDCKDVVFGDRKLSFCVRGWVDATNDNTRAVVEVHTYAWSGGRWIDSRSQSVTVNAALFAKDDGFQYVWGQDAAEKCRINGPAGTVGCSVPNTARVAFYSPGERYDGRRLYAGVYHVSFRDDRGVAHHSNSSLSQVWAEW